MSLAATTNASDMAKKKKPYESGFSFIDTNKTSELFNRVLKKCFDNALFENRI